jgi:hypothetical protein
MENAGTSRRRRPGGKGCAPDGCTGYTNLAGMCSASPGLAGDSDPGAGPAGGGAPTDLCPSGTGFATPSRTFRIGALHHDPAGCGCIAKVPDGAHAPSGIAEAPASAGSAHTPRGDDPHQARARKRLACLAQGRPPALLAFLSLAARRNRPAATAGRRRGPGERLGSITARFLECIPEGVLDGQLDWVSTQVSHLARTRGCLSRSRPAQPPSTPGPIFPREAQRRPGPDRASP